MDCSNWIWQTFVSRFYWHKKTGDTNNWCKAFCEKQCYCTALWIKKLYIFLYVLYLPRISSIISIIFAWHVFVPQSAAVIMADHRTLSHSVKSTQPIVWGFFWFCFFLIFENRNPDVLEQLNPILDPQTMTINHLFCRAYVTCDSCCLPVHKINTWHCYIF